MQIPRMVKVVEESSPYFKVISPTGIGHKVAPGVPSVFRILFIPEENKVTAVLARQWFECLSLAVCNSEHLRRWWWGGVLVVLSMVLASLMVLLVVVVRGMVRVGERRGGVPLGTGKDCQTVMRAYISCR